MTRLPITGTRPADGWCDAPSDRNYNRRVKKPYPASAETLWRDDGLYDIVIVISHNQSPRLRGRGSAIFIHIASEGYKPTEGCVALRKRHLVELLRLVSRRSAITIGASR